MRITGGRAAVALGAALLLMAGTLATNRASAQQAPATRADPATRPGLSQKQEDDLAHKHDGYYGALAPQNLHKPRPKPPFDMTGTWFVNLRHGFADFMFGPPYPEFYDAAKQAMVEAAAARAAHKSYRDSIGECFPAGMPMIMTRVWPTSIIQLPTSVHMIFGFTNSYRVIYLDGRKHTDPDISISTYNGESIGHWEGDSLVVSTKYLEPNQHWIDQGLPVSDQFEIVERYRLQDKGKTLEIQYTMTDPKNWKGEWHNTKHFIREDYSDVPEVECLPNLNANLPSTEKGHDAAEHQGSQPAAK
jgi:hypothetical protein